MLRQVLEDLLTPSAVFTLEVSDGLNECVAHFSHGGVRLLARSDRAGADISSRLLETNALTVDGLHRALEQARKHGFCLHEILISHGVIDTDAYRALLTSLVRDKFVHLSLWDDTYFAVTVDASPPPEVYGSDPTILAGPIDHSRLSEEVRHWLRDWSSLRGVIHSGGGRVFLTSEGRNACLDPYEKHRQVLLACRDGIDVITLSTASGAEIRELCATVVNLVRKGYVLVRPPAAPEGEELSSLIQRVEDLVPRAMAKGILLQRLADLYVAAGRGRTAVEKLEPLAEAALRNGQRTLAAEHLRTMLRVDPGNSDVFRKAFRAYLDDGEIAGALDLGVQQLDILLDLRLEPEAMEVAREFLVRTSADSEGGTLLAVTLSRSGKVQVAVSRFLTLAELFEQNGEKRLALESLDRALVLDPSHEKARAEIERLKPGFLKSILRAGNWRTPAKQGVKPAAR